MEHIKIRADKLGYHLQIGNKFIHKPYDNLGPKAILGTNGIPYGATEWVSICALRKYWNENRVFIIASLLFPYNSVWGNLERAW